VNDGRKRTLTYVTAWLILILWAAGIVVDFVGGENYETDPIFAVLMPIVAVWLFDVTIPGMISRDKETDRA
jgi:hypothetical protein